MLNDVTVILKDGMRVDVVPTEWKEARKKPVVIHAIQMPYDFEVETLEGLHTGKAGDYLLKGIVGEMYPVKKEIFLKTYDFISEANHNELQ